MSPVEIQPESYSYETAALASGYSTDVIRRAVRAGDLPVTKPKVAGKRLSKPVILREDLRAWLKDGLKHEDG